MLHWFKPHFCLGDRWFDFNIADDMFIGTFTCDPPFSSPFYNGERPTHINMFLQYLEEQGLTSVKLSNHIITREAGAGETSASYKIVAGQPAVFRVTQTFPPSRTKPNFRNAAAKIACPLLKKAGAIRLVQQFVCGPQICH